GRSSIPERSCLAADALEYWFARSSRAMTAVFWSLLCPDRRWGQRGRDRVMTQSTKTQFRAPMTSPFVPQITLYRRWLAEQRGLNFSDYESLRQWSVRDLDAFWRSIWDYF